MPAPAVVRAAGVRGYAEVVSELDGDPAAFARRCGVAPSALLDDEELVPVIAISRMLELTARDLGCPDLGLRVAARQDETILGPIAVALHDARTVGEGLRLARRFLVLHSPAVGLQVVPDPDGDPDRVAVVYEIPAPLSVPQSVDLGVGLLHRVLGSLAERGYRPVDVRLPHPALAPPQVYRAHLGAPVLFDQPRAALRVQERVLTRPVTSGEAAATRQRALRHLQMRAAREDAPVAPQVRAAVAGSLATAPLSLAAIARLLGRHPRTLQRRLAAEGESWAGIVDEARREASHHLLTRTDLPFGQVAERVALSEQSALTRCTRRWWSATPTEVRARRRRSQ